MENLIKITRDSANYYKFYNLSENDLNLGLKYKKQVKNKQAHIVEKLQKAIKENPQNILLQECLVDAYLFKKKYNKALEIIAECTEQYPNVFPFLIRKLLVLNGLGEYDKLEQFFGDKFKINELFPEIDAFLEDDVLFIYYLTFYLSERKSDIERARLIVSEFTKLEVEEKLKVALISQLNSFEQVLKIQQKQARIDALEAKLKAYQVTEKPVFIHTEIEQLYRHGVDIQIDILKSILQLPRETIIADLEKVLFDGIARFEAYQDNSDITENSFPIHALFLLAELQSESSLPLVLEFISYGDDFLEFWTGDIYLEYLDAILYKIYNKSFAPYLEFFDNYEIDVFIKSAIIGISKYIYAKEPQRKQEILEFFNVILEDIALKLEKKTDFDSEAHVTLFELVSSTIVDLNLEELKDKIEEIHAKIGHSSREITFILEEFEKTQMEDITLMDLEAIYSDMQSFGFDNDFSDTDEDDDEGNYDDEEDKDAFDEYEEIK